MASRAIGSCFVLGALPLAVWGAACGHPETNGLFGDATSSGAGAAGTSSSGGAGGASSSSSSGGAGGTPATCGNGHKDPGEQCDGADLGGQTCASVGYVEPAGLACTTTCKLDTSGCHAMCGNDKAEPGEKCDGTDLGGATCATFGYVSPAGLACSPDCSGWSATGCHAVCGNGKAEPGELCDGADLGGHTCKDLGYEKPDGLACKSCMLDGSSCKATCGNGIVEPGEECDDGATNGKPGDACSALCTTANNQTGRSCAKAIPISLPLGSTSVTGTTGGGGAHTAGCASAGPDIVYLVEVQADGFLTASLTRAATTFDSVLYIAKSCTDAAPNAALLCADSRDPSGQATLTGGEVVSVRVKAGDLYYVFVDGPTAGDMGSYQLVIDLARGLDCSDPVPIPLDPGTPMTLLGSTTNIPPGMAGTCGGTAGGQVVYKVTRPDSAPIQISTSATYTDYNSVLYARSSCGDMNSELACSNQGNLAQESIDLPNVTGGVPVYVWIDGSTVNGGAASGNFGLVLTP
jgi:cysteine-rich repeat protein